MVIRFGIPTFFTIIILVGAFLGIRSMDQSFEQYGGNGLSALASIEHSEETLVAGTIIKGNNTDLKDVIRKNKSKVVQIEREDGTLGSGFLYNDKGDIITNAHIVEGTSNVLVRTSDTQTYDGTVIGVGKAIDIAVVRVKELESLTPMNMAFEYEAEVGDEVITMGSPRGFQNSVSTGIISAVNRDFALNPYKYDQAYQISAPIAQGSSGGPLLLAATGEVVGVNSAAYQGEVIGFSIPIKNIWSLVTAWSNGKHPEEPISYQRVFLNEEGATGLINNFYKSIANYDYVSAYSHLGSEWQSKLSYDEFRMSFAARYSYHLTDLKATMLNDIVTIIAEVSFLELAENEGFIERIEKVTYEIGIENDKMKILELKRLSE